MQSKDFVEGVSGWRMARGRIEMYGGPAPIILGSLGEPEQEQPKPLIVVDGVTYAGMEGQNVESGQIICVADEMFSGRPNGGRISAATRRVITLDIDAEVHEEDWLIINLTSGKSEGRIVKSVSGHLVTVMADYSELPEPECSWSVESSDLAVMRFRV